MKLEIGTWYRLKEGFGPFPFGVKMMKFVGRSGQDWPCFENEYRGKKAMLNAVDDTFEIAV